jgi:hypothetical protein
VVTIFLLLLFFLLHNFTDGACLANNTLCAVLQLPNQNTSILDWLDNVPGNHMHVAIADLAALPLARLPVLGIEHDWDQWLKYVEARAIHLGVGELLTNPLASFSYWGRLRWHVQNAVPVLQRQLVLNAATYQACMDVLKKVYDKKNMPLPAQSYYRIFDLPAYNFFVVDVGIPNHVVNTDVNLHEYYPDPKSEEPIMAFVSTDKYFKRAGVGKLHVKTMVNDQETVTVIEDVWYCPGLECSIISLPALVKKGMWFVASTKSEVARMFVFNQSDELWLTVFHHTCMNLPDWSVIPWSEWE